MLAAQPTKPESNLKVMEALQEEAYKGIVRIDAETMQTLGIHVGEVIELEGARKTVGIADRAYPTDVGQQVIRMDGILRRNAKTGIGEYVKVRKAEIKEAKTLSIAPAQKGVLVRADAEIFKRALLGRAVLKGDIIVPGGYRQRRRAMSESPFFDDVFNMFEESFSGTFGMAGIRFVVINTNPKDAVLITESTELTLIPKSTDVEEEKIPEVTYEDIGGLKEEVKKLREMVELPLKHPEIFIKLGIEPPAGVLLHGPPGSGKTLLAKAVANETNAHFVLVNGPEIMNKFYGESERKIRDIFEDAEKNAPSIVFFDEIDAIAPKRDEVYGEVERRIVSQLLTQMDGLKHRGKVIVIGATNRPNAIDPALRRPGRFDREINIGPPDRKGRLNILKIHTRNMPLTKDVKLNKLADVTHGFVGADVAALCKEAAMNVLRRILPDLKLGEKDEIPEEVYARLRVTQEDFEHSLKIVRPSSLREVLIETPKTTWEDIGGLESVKQELKEAVEWPLKNPQAFKRLGIRPPRGLLMYGPPGTGKTLLAKAVANESEANFILVRGPELLNKWVGDSLPYNEEILVKKDGLITRMKIGDIVENKEDVEVLSFDKDKRISFSRISDHIKHPLHTRLLEVTTRTGRKIRVTEDHSLFSFVNGTLTDIPSSLLIPGESFIAIPKRLNLPKERIKTLNLYTYFKTKQDKDIFVGNITGYLIKAKKILGLKKIAEIMGTSKKSLADVICKNLPVALITFDNLMDEAGLALNYEEITIKLKGSTHSYPSLFTIDKDFWRLVGLWVAEGDLNGYTVRIHNSNPEIREDMQEICKRYKFITSEMKGSFTINSLFVQKIFTNVLGLPTGASLKRIPTLVFTLDKQSKAEFLKGYFSGDGSIYPAERGKFKIEAGTVSQELANDLLYLLLDFGIVAALYKKKERTGSIMHRISILGVKNFEAFQEIGFIDRTRNHRIKAYQDSRLWFRSDLIPLSGELYNLASQNMPIGNSLGKERLKQLLIYVDKDKTKYKEYWDLVEGDIFFDLVKEIKVLENEEYVYDLEVPGMQNFVAGFGGIFAHNSEKGIRKIFEKARQSSPAIIFFDEIDAIAPRRGMSEHQVTDRVVNTLLAEMDGLEDLAEVVVIGATNRPDIIDPALLRPGRFDKLLLTPPPNEKGRLEIFKIHTKTMPLAKDVGITELAKKTDGYVGADIEAVCREAAMLALREDLKAKEVTSKSFLSAAERVQPSVSKELMEKYMELEAGYFKKARAGLVKDIPSYVG